MSFARALAAAAVLSLAVPAATAAAPAKKLAARDWSRTVVATPEGGYRMGNPAAKVRLVEYGSLTCPHCRQFSATATAPLLGYVRTGKVSFEFRNYILNGPDIAASLIARCGGASRFFPVVEKFYETQPEWVGRIMDMPKAEAERLKALPMSARVQGLAKIGGMAAIAAGKGVTPAQSSKCLADPARLARLESMRKTAQAAGVRGTPTFFINGVRAPVNEWPSLEPLIREAGG